MPAMPTKGMREEAQRYRDWKEDGRDGGTEVGRSTCQSKFLAATNSATTQSSR